MGPAPRQEGLIGGHKTMEASAVSHIAICTRDMEKSLAFYRDMLGMRVLSDGYTDPAEGGLLQELVAKGAQLGGPRASFTNAAGRIRSFYVYDPDGIIIQFDSGLNEG